MVKLPKKTRELIKNLTEEAIDLLKNLSVINADLETNIDRKIVEKSYQISNFDKVFNEIIEKGIIPRQCDYNIVRGVIDEKCTPFRYYFKVEYETEIRTCYVVYSRWLIKEVGDVYMRCSE